MSKSHVSMEQHLCIVCCKPVDTGAILIDKRLRQTLERTTVTGWGMCEEHQKLKDAGFVALIACDPTKTKERDGVIKAAGDAYRTGTFCHLRETAFVEVINVPVPENMVCFCDEEVINQLQVMSGGPNPGTPKEG